MHKIMNKIQIELKFTRRINPSTRKQDNLPQVSSDEAIKLNKRKLIVNAQIAATISIIESTTMISYTIAVAITVRTSYGTLIYLLLLYMIILPYSLLKNTSDNKERIIEQGWMNIFKNIFGKLLEALGVKNVVEPSIPLATISNDVETRTAKIGKESDVSGNKDDIEIASVHDQIDKDEVPAFDNSQNLDEEQASTSQIPRKETSRKEKYQRNLQKLVSKMIQNIEQEEKYIGYFQSYVSLTEAYKNDDFDIELDMKSIESILTDNFQLITKMGKSKGSKNKRSTLTTNTSGKINPIGSKVGRNLETSKFKGTQAERILKRKQMLSKIISKNMNDENFATLIEDLIILEESFVL